MRLQHVFPRHGYAAHEVARLDRLEHASMGKDYGGRAWELATMGVEDLFNPSQFPKEIAGDPGYLDFILGLLAGVG
jgi:hypothetical protein